MMNKFSFRRTQSTHTHTLENIPKNSLLQYTKFSTCDASSLNAKKKTICYLCCSGFSSCCLITDANPKVWLMKRNGWKTWYENSKNKELNFTFSKFIISKKLSLYYCCRYSFKLSEQKSKKGSWVLNVDPRSHTHAHKITSWSF